jgi:hypothetical protein
MLEKVLVGFYPELPAGVAWLETEGSSTRSRG